MRLLIAIPALNERANIGSVLEGLPETLEGVEEISTLVVDDGSTDGTARIAMEHGARVVCHPRNIGVGAAFQSAVTQSLECGTDLLVTIDADGQFDPGEMGKLVAPLINDEADFVTGTRFAVGARPKNMPWVKYKGNLMVARLLRSFTGSTLSDVSCGYRAYSREALYHLNLFGKFTYTQETILDLSFKNLRLAEVPISVKYGEGRRSRVAGSVSRYAMNASKIILRTARDFKPMRFFGLLGAAVFLLGAVLDAWMLAYFLRVGSFTPYKFVGFTGVSLNIGGVLVFGVALLADMLDRMRVNQERLLYHVRRQTYDRR